MKSFEELGISSIVCQSLEQMGFEEPTPIQSQTIPLIQSGSDLLGQAQTGTGKTAAFGIPVIDKIDTRKKQVQALILAPTRELAIQVSEEIYKIGKTKRLHVLPIYGGQDIGRQIKALNRGVHIVVGTPGRVLDHLNRNTLKTESLRFMVLDEADEMLNMGFIEDIESILEKLPSEKQTLLFSATMPRQIQKISERFMHEPELIKIKNKELTVPLIEQFFVPVVEKEKFEVLSRFLDIHSPELAIVFGRTKRRVDELSEALQRRGYSAEGIHGDLTQAKRISVLRRFKEGSIDILVATDVAARGLDISGVTHVYNFDIPQDPESYVHRIGRTGRAGKQGQAFSFITPREKDQLALIEHTTKKRMQRLTPPSPVDVIEEQIKALESTLEKAIENGDHQKYVDLAQKLLSKEDAVNWFAAALKQLVKDPTESPIVLTSESPVVANRAKMSKLRGGGSHKGNRNHQGGGNRGGKGGYSRGNNNGGGRGRYERSNERSGERSGERRNDRNNNDRRSGKPRRDREQRNSF